MTGSEYLERQKKAFKNTNAHNPIKANLRSLQDAEKAGCLFHGSFFESTIKKLEVQKTHLDTKRVVFAGKLWVGLSFLGRWTDADMEQGTINGKPYMTARSKTLSSIYDKGGFLYQVSPLSFHHTDKLTQFEFVSYEDVTPIASIFIPNPLELLKLLGVDLKEKHPLVSVLSRWHSM